MTKTLAVSLVVLATLSLPLSISAHDKKMHKGKATEGEITSVTGNRFEMKTATGAVTVALSSTTKVEHGDAVVDKSHLKVGEHVSVFGTKISKGEIAASSVLLGTANHRKMEGMDHSKMKETKPAPKP